MSNAKNNKKPICGTPPTVAPRHEKRKQVGVYLGETDFNLLKKFQEHGGYATVTEAARAAVLKSVTHPNPKK